MWYLANLFIFTFQNSHHARDPVVSKGLSGSALFLRGAKSGVVSPLEGHLFLCPLPGCNYQTPCQHNLWTHWERMHGATRPITAHVTPSLHSLIIFIFLNRPQHHRVNIGIAQISSIHSPLAWERPSSYSAHSCWAPMCDPFLVGWVYSSHVLPHPASRSEYSSERRLASATITSGGPDRDNLLTQLREVDGQRLALKVACSNLIW